MRIIIFFLILVVLSSCSKDMLPVNVELGEFKILVNDQELLGFSNSFRYRPKLDVIGFSFLKLEERHLENIYFGLAPLKVGDFEISYPESQQSLYDDNIAANYSNLYDIDLMGDPYDLDDPETAFFEITELDTIEQTVKGRFDVRFKRRDRSGEGSERGRKLHFEGLFYDFYTVE